MPDPGRHLVRPAIAGCGLIILLAGCSAQPPAASKALRPPAAELATFLPDPAPLAAPGEALGISEWHRRLLRGESPVELRLEVEREAAAPVSLAARVLLAELDLVARDAAGARARLAGVGPDGSASPIVGLVAGRAAELEGEALDAWLAYGRVDGRDDLAQRRARLAPEARAAAAARLAESLDRGETGRAAPLLAALRELAPDSVETVRAEARFAALRREPGTELSALTRLASLLGEATPLSTRLRIGELQVEVGDAPAGLARLEGLAAAHPEDAGARAALMRSRFRFRLSNSPDIVRAAAGRAQLDRADFAVLLYWLVPEVRASRAGTAQIATDILDQPASEEIMRVANLGLLDVDPAMHRFEPNRALRRGEAFLALARVRKVSTGHAAAACDFATDMGWIGERAECLAGGPVSGGDAVRWIADATGFEESR